MKIVSKAPCRISLVGGGTDVDPFASKYGGKVLNLAINLYHTITLIPHQSAAIKLKALDETRVIPDYHNRLSYGQHPKFDLLHAIINYFSDHLPSGFSLTVSQTAENLLGLGRSGSAAVATITAFNAWLDKTMSPLAIGLLAARLEIKDLGWPGGKQDSLVAAYGGLNLMTFGPGQTVTVKQLKLSFSALSQLTDWLLLVNIGGQRHSGDQQTQLVKSMSQAKNIKALLALKQAVVPAKATLLNQDWPALGEILHQGWQNKKKSNPKVSNQLIDDLYNLARDKGALGGKISGSGGGGHLLFIIPPAKKPVVLKALKAHGAKLVKFVFDLKGVRVKQT